MICIFLSLSTVVSSSHFHLVIIIRRTSFHIIKMDLSQVSVTIQSALGIGGIHPFVVVCYDNEIDNEIFKTPSFISQQDLQINQQFTLDLLEQDKSRPSPPAYLCFFIYDRGVQGVPSLGSAGVLLDTLREKGAVQGDFPVVNGNGMLRLDVQGGNEEKSWYKTDTAKVAGIVGVGALTAAAGVGLSAFVGNKKKKNKLKDQNNEEEEVSKDVEVEEEDVDGDDEVGDDEGDDDDEGEQVNTGTSRS